mmetsp:Transcript_9203/g.35998  ORF Transcript_9203/g.35998 Transcript_9203/m.35998 type:complete len:215 (+) Transcript_9203:468-1112(+)
MPRPPGADGRQADSPGTPPSSADPLLSPPRRSGRAAGPRDPSLTVSLPEGRRRGRAPARLERTPAATDSLPPPRRAAELKGPGQTTRNYPVAQPRRWACRGVALASAGRGGPPPPMTQQPHRVACGAKGCSPACGTERPAWSGSQSCAKGPLLLPSLPGSAQGVATPTQIAAPRPCSGSRTRSTPSPTGAPARYGERRSQFLHCAGEGGGVGPP